MGVSDVGYNIIRYCRRALYFIRHSDNNSNNIITRQNALCSKPFMRLAVASVCSVFTRRVVYALFFIHMR